MVANGGFGSGDAWTEWRHRGDLAIDYGYTDARPTGGSGPCLRFSGGGDARGGVYQALTLEGGRSYRLSGVFRDIGSSPHAAWVEVFLRADEPVQGEDYRGERPPGTRVDLNTSSLDEIREYFASLSAMDYAVYEGLRHWLTTDESPGPLPASPARSDGG